MTAAVTKPRAVELRLTANPQARVAASKDQRVPAVWKRYGG